MPDNNNAARKPHGYAGRTRAPQKDRASRAKASPARLAALDAVRAVRERDAFAQDVIGARIDNSDLTPQDRAFATKLVLGVVSSWGTLDEVIDRSLRKPTDVQADVRDALRVSTYEILFLDKTPHAAVDQGVELVRSFAPKAAGLANAVLRKIVDQRTAFPFGDPARDGAACARLHAFPVWLAQKLVTDLGPQAAVEFMKASNEPAPLFVAVNAAKTDEATVLKAFEEAGERAIPAAIDGERVPGCLHVPDGRALLAPSVKRLLAQGALIVSDAASQLVAASVLPAQKPASFLEIGAGRATKTILIQSDAQRTYSSQIDEYVTLDNHAFKTKLLLERAAQCGVHVAEALTGDALALDDLMPGRVFDVVFIDAPCSGLGTLRRHPEIRWRVSPADIAEFARLQVGMLQAAAAHVAVGGTLAYATCTVSHEENNGVVRAFLESKEGASFALAPINGRGCVATQLFTGASDAHFAVRFTRTA